MPEPRITIEPEVKPAKISKVVYDGRVLIDLTSDTVTETALLTGYTAHNKTGNMITGVCPYDSDTSSATATAAEVLAGKTFYARGSKGTGSMYNNGAIDEEITEKDEEITVPQGYHDGSGKVSIASVEKDKLISGNIKEGVSILGITGTLKPSSAVTAQTKTVTPSTTKQTIIPDEGTDYLSQVTVNAIPYTEASNSAGGITVTIAG